MVFCFDVCSFVRISIHSSLLTPCLIGQWRVMCAFGILEEVLRSVNMPFCLVWSFERV